MICKDIRMAIFVWTWSTVVAENSISQIGNIDCTVQAF